MDRCGALAKDEAPAIRFIPWMSVSCCFHDVLLLAVLDRMGKIVYTMYKPRR